MNKIKRVKLIITGVLLCTSFYYLVNFLALFKSEVRSKDNSAYANPKALEITEKVDYSQLESYYQSIPRADYANAENEAEPVWIARGPFNVSGRTRAVAVDRNNSNILFAGGISGALYRSIDKGQTWNRVSSPSFDKSVSCIVQDPREGFGNIWYYSTGELFQAASTGDERTGSLMGSGIFMSEDNGLTWKKIIRDFGFYQKIVVSKVTGQVFAAQGMGFSKVLPDEHGREIWFLDRFIEHGQFCHTDIFINHETDELFGTIATEDGLKIFYAPSSVSPFRDITPSFHQDKFAFPMTLKSVIGGSPNNPNRYTLYFFNSHMEDDDTENPFGFFICNVSKRNGEVDFQWRNQTQFLPEDIQNSNFDAYKMCIAVKPDNPDVVFIGHKDLYRSLSGFRNSRTEKIATHKNSSELKNQHFIYHVDQQSITFFPNNPNHMLVGTDGGVYYTSNNMAKATNDLIGWNSLNFGYNTNQVYSVSIPQERNSNMLVAGVQDNGTWISFDNGENHHWTQLMEGDGMHCTFTNENKVYASSQSGKISKLNIFKNEGSFSVDKVIESNFEWGRKPFYCTDPNNNAIFYVADDTRRIRRYGLEEDFGYVPEFVVNQDDFISVMEISKFPSTSLYVGTKAGKLFKILNPSSNNPVVSDITHENFRDAVSWITIDSRNSENIFAVVSNRISGGVFYSNDGGEEWHDVGGIMNHDAPGDFRPPSVRCLAIHRVDENPDYLKILLGTSIGLYSTRDIDLNDEGRLEDVRWAMEAENSIGNTIITDIECRSSDGMVAIATYGHGVFTTKMGFENNPVYALKEIPDIVFKDENDISILPLSDYFRDLEGDPISYRVTSNSNYDAVSAWVRDEKLFVNASQSTHGSSFITLKATSNGKSIYSHFRAEVSNGESALFDQVVDGNSFYASSENRMVRVKKMEDDFYVSNDQLWDVNSIFVEGKRLSRFVNPSSVKVLIEQVEGDRRIEVLNRSFRVDGDNIQVSEGRNNKFDLTVNFNEPLRLSNGHYWLSVTPVILESNDEWLWKGDAGNGNAREYRRGQWRTVGQRLSFAIRGTLANERAYRNIRLFSAQQKSETQIDLNWKPLEWSSSLAPAGIVIERQNLRAERPSFEQVAFIHYKEDSYSDISNFTPGATYVYRIKVVGKKPSSGYVSDRVNFKGRPNVPQNFRVLRNTSDIAILCWDQLNTRLWRNSPDELKLYRSYNPNHGYVKVGDLNTNSWTFLDALPRDGERYFYKLIASNIAGSSSSITVDCISFLHTPENFSALRQGNGDVLLEWEDLSSSELGYKIYKALNEEDLDVLNDQNLLTIVDANITKFADKQASGNAVALNYYYKIKAYNWISESVPTRAIQTEEADNFLNSRITRSVKQGENIILFPNPTEGQFNLRLGKDITEANVTISSLDGKIILEQKVNSLSQASFDLSNKSRGTYIVKVVSSDNQIIITEKIILR